VRQGPEWNARALTAGDALRMPEIEVELPLSDIYVDAPLSPQDAEDQSG